MDRSIAAAIVVTGLILHGCSTGDKRAPGHVVSDAWFARDTTPRVRAAVGREPRAALPPEVTEFSTSDPYVYTWVITREAASHRVRGIVKADRDDISGIPFTYEVPTAQADLPWRSWWYRIPMSRLWPGKWTVELLVDDLPAGTYRSVVK